MRILAIGNSFSQDATRYLHDIAAADGTELKVVNLYIGGCSLERHAENCRTDAAAYDLELNGHRTHTSASIRSALLSDCWDYVTMQQVSQLSVDYATFQPYLQLLSDDVRRYAPQAVQVLHETWAYAEGSPNLMQLGYSSHEAMFADVERAYRQASAALADAPLIPSGHIMRELLRSGIPSIHRDPIHASLGLGRYALALGWYAFFTGNSVEQIYFSNFDEPVSPAEAKLAKACVQLILKAPGEIVNTK